MALFRQDLQDFCLGVLYVSLQGQPALMDAFFELQ
jgi:hypothetical protein